MDWLIYAFGSGAAFFLGAGCVLASLIVFSINERPWVKVFANLGAAVGMILGIFSATPLPYWLCAVAALITVSWLV